MAYIHEHSDWPNFRWDRSGLSVKLADIRHRQGRLLGRMEGLGFDLRSEASIRTLTSDVIKSSEIEGEVLDRDTVRSSIAQRLGLETVGTTASDRHVDGVVDMMLDATQNHAEPLDPDRLFGWHAALFPTGRSGISRITVGAWRPGPMEVVSGPYGRERIHFEAPAASRLPSEMSHFFDWFGMPPKTDPVIHAAIAHLWFVTIHPFDDGNGRIARAIADMALARAEGSPQRFYSMSTQIRQERTAYYDQLETTQKGDLDVTPWLTWFLDCLGRAFDGSEDILQSVFQKARFWEQHRHDRLNDRQRDMLNRLLDGFIGKLTTSKYAKVQNCSQDTAYRDINELMALRALKKDPAGGRSTSYSLVLEPVQQ
ncbi:Fic family protein [uncultured Tateyamaria sp.]|uniref:Fic family protein n=1 Tax=uncultured Tateyamaria sp. TaxID=455651 RepID=UPI00262F9A3C|nr:Fic family protein [uncultured Tateyamaria sp.]